MSEYKHPRCPRCESYMEDDECPLCDDRLGWILNPYVFTAIAILIVWFCR